MVFKEIKLDLVYFIKINEFVKIGKGNPTSRLGTAREWSPYPVELLAICIGREKDLHRRFKEDRLRKGGRGREWFYLSKEINDFIREHGIKGKTEKEILVFYRSIKSTPLPHKKVKKIAEVSNEDVLDRSIYLEEIKKSEIS